MGENIPTLIAGIDEAGRGPVIGDMVIGYTALSVERQHILYELGVMDSKKLSRYRREIIFHKLCEKMELIGSIIITPYHIESRNLNKITLRNIMRAIKTLLIYAKHNNYEAVQIYIDEVKGVKNKLVKDIEGVEGDLEVDIYMEAGADEKYPIVSAASIIAKYYRDHSLKPLRRIFGEIGSGYPSDARTVEWIRNMYKKYPTPPRIVRRKWKTLERIAPRWYIGGRIKSILDYI